MNIPTQQEIDDAATDARHAQDDADEAEDAAERLHNRVKRMREAVKAEEDRRQASRQRADRVQAWLDRERFKIPGLNRGEIDLIERLIDDLEAAT